MGYRGIQNAFGIAEWTHQQSFLSAARPDKLRPTIGTGDVFTYLADVLSRRVERRRLHSVVLQ